jgi:hypothetical protein
MRLVSRVFDFAVLGDGRLRRCYAWQINDEAPQSERREAVAAAAAGRRMIRT